MPLLFASARGQLRPGALSRPAAARKLAHYSSKCNGGGVVHERQQNGEESLSRSPSANTLIGPRGANTRMRLSKS